MRKTILAMLLAVTPVLGLAAGSDFPLREANVDVSNNASIQNGARLFVNYCMGCHSAEHQRYNRLGRDAGMSDEQVLENLVFTGAKVGDTMQNAMSKADAKRWFGAPPPDLTLIARSRGVDYLYTYLTTFYADETRPFGVNNAVFPSVGMPHVMWEQQGLQRPVYKTTQAADGSEIQVLEGFELAQPGARSVPEFEQDMRDLVTFLAYIAEPIQLERQRLGWWVLGFLLLSLGVFYPLKKEYWKDVHG